MSYQVSIQNFQSIHNVAFSISGFTILVGANDIGKSSVFRSLQAVFKNRVGDDFITIGTSSCQVDVKFAEHHISWSKARKTGAVYTWNDNEPYDKTGHKAPDFIQQLGFGEIELNAGKLKTDRLDPHFSKQGEGPFLFSSSDTVLTEFFSEVLKFGDLARATQACSKDLKTTLTDIKVVDQEIARSSAHLALFNGLEDITSGVAECERLNQELDNVNACLVDLEAYKTLCRIIDCKIEIPFDDMYDQLNKATEANKTLADIETYKTLCAEIEANPYHTLSQGLEDPSVMLNDWIPQLQDAQAKLELVEAYKKLCRISEFVLPDVSVYEKQLKQLKDNAETLELIRQYKKLCDLPVVDLGKLESLSKYLLLIQYMQVCLELQRAEVAYESGVQELERLTGELQDAFKELGMCPLCERTI